MIGQMCIEACREICASDRHNLDNHRKYHSVATICFEDLCRICTKTNEDPLCPLRNHCFITAKNR